MPGLATFSWRDQGDEVLAEPADAGQAEIEDAYRRCVLPMALHTRGMQVLHASAVEMPMGAIAFCGASGAGKSTMAAALGDRGNPPVADDALLFEPANEAIRVHQLPFSIRLMSESGGNGSGPKEGSILFAEQRPPLPLHAVFVLDRSPEVQAPEVERLPRHEAFSLMLYHARFRNGCAYMAERIPNCEMMELTLPDVSTWTDPGVLDHVERPRFRMAATEPRHEVLDRGVVGVRPERPDQRDLDLRVVDANGDAVRLLLEVLEQHLDQLRIADVYAQDLFLLPGEPLVGSFVDLRGG